MSDEIIKNIRTGKYSKKELENFYSNAERLGRIEILEAAREALKEIDSRSYSKRFVKPIRDKIEEIAKDIANANNWGEWKENKVGNGVKPGDRMLKGEVLAEHYFSYRHPSWKKSSALSVFQENENSSVRYAVRAHDGERVIVDTSQEAVKLYKQAINP
jgi:hypothetical protein